MRPFSTRLVVESTLFAGLLSTCLGSYFGNVFIALGHIFLGLAIVLQLFILWKEFREGTPRFKGSKLRWSTWFLLAIVVSIWISILANLGDVDQPLSVLKKSRYHLIWAGMIVVPGLRWLFLQRFGAWAPWLLQAWLWTVSLASLSGLVGGWTGYNPLLLAPDPYPTRASGVSSMVMTYAYGIQFSVLLSLGLLIAGSDLRLRFLRTGTWMKGLMIGSFLISVLGLYCSYTRGALVGALSGVVCLLLMQHRKYLLIGLGCLTLAGGALALREGNRYVYLARGDPARVSQWVTAWHTFLDRPLFGVGYRQFEEKCVLLKAKFGMPLDHVLAVDGEKVPVYFSGHAHNEFLEALASTGLLGGVAFLGFLVYWAREVTQQKWARFFFFPVLVAFAVSGLVQNMFTDSEVLNFLLFLYFLSQVVLDLEARSGEPRLRSFADDVAA